MTSRFTRQTSSLAGFCMLTLAILVTTPAHAAPLTLNEALALATIHSPVIAAAQAQERGAQAALTTATAFANPELELASGRARPLQIGGNSGYSGFIGMSQLVELPSLRAARRQGAEAGITSGNAALSYTQLNQTTAVKQAFFEALRRQEETNLAKENYELLLQIRNRVKVKVEVGESPRYELVKAGAEVLAAESAAMSAEFRVTQSHDRLRGLIGSPLDKNFVVALEPLSLANLPELEELRRDLLASQPLLKVTEAERQRAQAKLEQERAARLPQPTLKLTSERDPDMSQWRIGVALPLPLWNRREGQIGEALAAVQRAEADAKQANLSLLAQLDQTYSQYQIAKRQVRTFESGLMSEAENALKVAEAAYNYGERGILDYLDAQRVLRTTRLDFLNARYELQAALLEIERLRATTIAGDTL